MKEASGNNGIEAVPVGAWAVGVSGGADSVALLSLLRPRGELRLHVVHLDHETRGGASGDDAEFVRQLSRQLGIVVTIARYSDVATEAINKLRNRSARFRAARLELFRRIVQTDKLDGVILAHHADDQAETVLQRILRGAGPSGLGAMASVTTLGGLTVLRPLLETPRDVLRAMLLERGITWREDASNAQPDQQRNRVRKLLAGRLELREALVELARACRAHNHWLAESAPMLEESFDVEALQKASAVLGRESARRWLETRAGDGVEVPPAAVERLVQMATDMATPARRHFPGGVLVRRAGGRISVVEKSGGAMTGSLRGESHLEAE